MVQHFQTLPEVGRSGLKVCTIPKSIKTAQKHGAASIQEAWGPCWSHPKIMVSLVHFVTCRRSANVFLRALATELVDTRNARIGPDR